MPPVASLRRSWYLPSRVPSETARVWSAAAAIPTTDNPTGGPANGSTCADPRFDALEPTDQTEAREPPARPEGGREHYPASRGFERLFALRHPDSEQHRAGHHAGDAYASEREGNPAIHPTV